MFFASSKPPGGPAPIRLISNGGDVQGVLVNNNPGSHPPQPTLVHLPQWVGQLQCAVRDIPTPYLRNRALLLGCNSELFLFSFELFNSALSVINLQLEHYVQRGRVLRWIAAGVRDR